MVDSDFTAKLVDVYTPNEDFPSGFGMNISDALVRVTYRDDRHTSDLTDPGPIYRLVVRPFPTANVFKKGLGFAWIFPAATSPALMSIRIPASR